MLTYVFPRPLGLGPLIIIIIIIIIIKIIILTTYYLLLLSIHLPMIKLI